MRCLPSKKDIKRDWLPSRNWLSLALGNALSGRAFPVSHEGLPGQALLKGSQLGLDTGLSRASAGKT